MKRFLKILLWVLVAALFIGTFVYLFINSRRKADVFEIVAPADSITIERTTVLTGKIEPRDEIEIKPQISGIIAEIMVEPGDHVSDGDIIARIKVIPSAAELSSAQNRLEVARIALTDATDKYERARLLFEKKVLSREDLETATATWRKASAEVDAATDALAIVRDGAGRSNASASNTNVRATVTGIVLDVPVKVGSSVIQANTMNDGTTVATIADMNNLIFRGKIDETEVGLLRVGMPMEIVIGALPDIRPRATIEYIAPKGVENNGANTFEVKAAITTDGDAGLRSGYSANATVRLDGGVMPLAVPESVVEFSADSTFVYVLTDSVGEQKFERRAIVTGMSDGINVEVKSGIDRNARLRGNKIFK